MITNYFRAANELIFFDDADLNEVVAAKDRALAAVRGEARRISVYRPVQSMPHACSRIIGENPRAEA